MQAAKFILCTLFFIVSITSTIAQTDPYFANNSIGLCNQYADTLTLDQINGCTEITINSKKNISITSYIFSYYINDQLMLHSVQGFSNKVAKEEIEQMLSIKPKVLFLTEILGECNSEILILGQRKIFIR
jgi:hypothetical protein